MKKLIYAPILSLVVVSGLVFISSCRQNQTSTAQNSTGSEAKKSTTVQMDQGNLMKSYFINAEVVSDRDAEAIYQSSSPGHNLVHEFTYLVAMRNYCHKTLLQMRENGEVDNKLYQQLEKELTDAKSALTASKFDGLKIELALYEKFFKQINDRFGDRC